MDKSIKVIIIDDHMLVREGMKQVIATEDWVEVIGEADNGKEGMRLVTKLHPDVVFLDISLPGMGGLEVLTSMREAVPKTKVVILSMHGKKPLVQEALRAGASAYILKGGSGYELIAALRAVAQGEFYFSAKLRRSLVSSYLGTAEGEQDSDQERYQSLTEREKQYFNLMLTGKSTQDICQVLFISTKTGQKHRTNIFEKLKVNNQLEMFKLGYRLGLIDLEMPEKNS